MDFWDLTKLLVRRWMVGLPLLLLSAGLAVLTLMAVKPDYKTTAHVQLIPPVSGATTPGQSTVDQRNPWIGMGMQTISNAAIVTVTDQSVVDALHAGGYSDSYTVTLADNTPLVTFEIVAKTPEQARATTEELVTRFTKSVSGLQNNVSQADMITTRRLDTGITVVQSSSKVKRAVIAVGGAGILMTAGVTVGVDAWLVRRRRNKEEAGRPAGRPVTQPRAPAPRLDAPRIDPIGSGLRQDALRLPPLDSTAVIPLGNGSSAAKDGADKAGKNAGSRQPVATTYGSDNSRKKDEPEVEQALPMPSDATIVLPVSLADRPQWTRQGKKS